MAGKVKRSLLATFIDVVPDSGSPQYELMGPGITEQTIAYNPQTEEETYIHEDSGVTELLSYRPTVSTPQTAIAGDPVFDFIDGLRQKRAVLSESKTTIVMVYKYSDDGSTSYPAEQQRVGVQIDDFGGEGGGSLSINYTLNFDGDPQKGIFDPDSKTFTAQ
jgi:hypothetical protein